MKCFFIILIIGAVSGRVMAQEHYIWSGRVMDLDSRSPIVGVHFRSSKQQGISDHDGYFEILVKKGEQVLISHVAYQTLDYYVPNDFIPKIIWLTPGEREMVEVTVTSMPSETELKRLLLHTTYIPTQMEVNMGYNISYMNTIYQLRNNHIENSIDQMYKRIRNGNGEATFLSTNPSMGILGVIRSFRKSDAIPFEKQRYYHSPQLFKASGDTTIRFKKYFD